MKTFIKKYIAAMFASLTLAILALTANAQPTNFVAYNFDTDQVTGIWGNFFGGYFVSAAWDSTTDAGNNPSSGSMQLVLNCSGHDQYVLWDGISPGYSLDSSVFTNISWDMRYDGSSAVRTNAGTGNGSQGPGSLDFGYMRLGFSKSYDQDWVYYFAISATNSAGQPNTNWVHMSVDLRQAPISYAELTTYSDVLFGMDGGNYGNSGLVGPQTIWFDNIVFHGFAAPVPPPHMAILKTTPALRMFGGGGVYGRSQLALQDVNEGWVGGSFPVTYSFTLLGNAASPGNLDTHIQFIPNASGNYSGLDYISPNELWLRIVSGTGTNTCVADISWKTNNPNSNPNQGNHTDLQITNTTRAGTWTLTFNSDTNGTLTAPGASPVPFTLSLADADVTANFPNGSMVVRIGNQNNGNGANSGVPDDWGKITISGTPGAPVNENFSAESTDVLDPSVWNLGTSDGQNQQILVPTNAPYWITWNTPDTGYALETATSLLGPWNSPEFYNSYADGGTANGVAAQTTQSGLKWNLMLSTYLPTVEGTPGGTISRNAYFKLSNPPPAQ